MKQNATLRLRITHLLDGDSQTSRYDYEAYGIKKTDSWLFTYKEEMDEGLHVQTVLKLTDEEISLLRQGGIQMNQRFTQGVRTQGVYRSPYGPMRMETHTSHVQVDWEQERPVQVAVGYQLWLNEQETGEYMLEVAIHWHEK
ncbi:MAG: DUF1934 domain-containing protein [Clostridia bacterium]